MSCGDHAYCTSLNSRGRAWQVPWGHVAVVSSLLIQCTGAQNVSPMPFFSGQGVSPNFRRPGSSADHGGAAPGSTCFTPEAGSHVDGSDSHPTWERAHSCSLEQGESSKLIEAEVSPDLRIDDFTEVFVSVLLNKLLVVDEQKYQFEVVFHLRMSWTDPRAEGEIQRRTEETFAQGKQDSCERLCGGGVGQALCCDTVWLPGLHSSNIVGMPDEGSDAEVISLVPGDHSHVVWKRRIHSTFHSPLFFQRFPFDQQRLLMEFLATGCCYFFTPSSVGMRMTYNSPYHLKEKLPTQISSWKTEGVSISSHPYSLERSMVWSQDAHPRERFDLRTEYIIGGRNFKSVNTSFAVIVEIHRLWFYYVVMNLGPMFLTVVLSWATLCVTPEYLELRIATSITLYLALSSERAVIFESLPHSNYVTIMGYIIVWSYIMIVATVFQSLLVSFVYSVSSKVEEEKKLSTLEEAAKKLTMVQHQLQHRDSNRPGRENPWAGYLRGPLTPGPWALSHTTSSTPLRKSPQLEPLSSSVSRSLVGSQRGISLKCPPEAGAHTPDSSPVLHSLRFPLSIPGKVLSTVSSVLNPFRSTSSSAGHFSRDVSLAEDEALLDDSLDASLALRGGGTTQKHSVKEEGGAVQNHAALESGGSSITAPPLSTRSARPAIPESTIATEEGEVAAHAEQESSKEGELVPPTGHEPQGAQPAPASIDQGKGTLSPVTRSATSLRARRRAMRLPSKGKKKGVSESKRLELPQLQDISKDPSRAKIFISRLDGYCLFIFPLIYVAGLVYIYLVVD